MKGLNRHNMCVCVLCCSLIHDFGVLNVVNNVQIAKKPMTRLCYKLSIYVHATSRLGVIIYM